jgi:hypothetical protein
LCWFLIFRLPTLPSLTPTPAPSCHFPLRDLIKVLVDPVPVYISFSIVVPSSRGRCTQLYFQIMSFKAMDPPDDDAALVAATIPVVLRVMPLLGFPAPVGYIMTPLLPLMGGCWRLPLLSSLTTAIKSSLTHAWTLSRIAGLGGSRRQSSTWIGFPTTFCPRVSTSLSLLPLLPRWTPSALPLWRCTFSHPRRLFPKVWSPFPPLGAVSWDGPSLF